MITRQRTPETINRIAANPEVRSTYNIRINSFVPLDFTEMCKREDYIVLSNGIDAVSIFDQQTPVVFDGHSMFDETCRGKDALEIGQEMLDWMWNNTQALIITGKTPIENRRARFFNRKLGFSSSGTGLFHDINHKDPYEVEFFHIMRPTTSNS